MKRLLSIVLLIGLAPLVAGCANFSQGFARIENAFEVATTATVPASTAQISVSSFQVIEAAATGYFRYCKTSPADSICAPGTVANPGPLRIAIKYDRQGRNARDQIKAAGKSGALISTTVYNLLTDAITNLTNSPVSNFGATK